MSSYNVLKSNVKNVFSPGFIYRKDEVLINKEKVLYPLLIDKIAVRVIAGYKWAKETNFDKNFNEKRYSEHRDYAINELSKAYSARTNPAKIIDLTINHQAEIVYLRRKHEGKYSGHSEYEYNRDRWEAEHFVAYLFFEEIIGSCLELGPCFFIKHLKEEVISLLDQLTVEKFYQIKGYLLFLDRCEKKINGQGVHGHDHDDYLASKEYLKNVFAVCSGESGKTSKMNSHPRRFKIINFENINTFAADYSAFIELLKFGNQSEKRTIEVLAQTYNRSLSKIVNIMELLLKIMITSYIHGRTSAIPGQSKILTNFPVTFSKEQELTL